MAALLLSLTPRPVLYSWAHRAVVKHNPAISREEQINFFMVIYFIHFKRKIMPTKSKQNAKVRRADAGSGMPDAVNPNENSHLLSGVRNL
jgi:hypothetical protein